VAEYGWSDVFQRKIVALLIREPAKMMSLVEPKFFASPILTDIARLVKEIYAHHKEPITLSRSTLSEIVKAWLGRKRRELWRAYRHEIRLVYGDKLRDKIVILNQAIEFAKDMKFRDALAEAEKDVNARHYDNAIKRFHDLAAFGQESDLGVEYWKDITARDRWREDRVNVIRTFYFPTLDKYMAGGLGGGELAIILASPKAGQSTILGDIAAGAMWQKKTVAIATGEISAKKYRRRIDALMSGVPANELTRSKRARVKARKRLRISLHQVKGKLFIKQFPTGRARIRDIEAWLDELEEQGHKVDLLVVDYLYLFQPNEKFEERRMNIGQAAIDLRGLACTKSIPIWTASKGNRAALEKEILGPKDFAEDISQFWVLDFLIALCQSNAEAQVKPERARLILSYARDVGRGGVIPIKMDRSIYAMSELRKSE
jgi:archaellum biogenesis ATPase FlaH